MVRFLHAKSALVGKLSPIIASIELVGPLVFDQIVPFQVTEVTPEEEIPEL
jgi:hypothetical protein